MIPSAFRFSTRFVFGFAFFLSLTGNSQTEASVDFNQAIHEAVSQIEEVQSKESEVRSAEIGRRQSLMQFLPDLNLAGSYAEFDTEIPMREIDRSYGLKSNLNLFRFGGDLQFYRSADFTAQSLRNDLVATRLRLEEIIVGKALDFIASHQETVIRKKLIDAQRSFFSVAEKRYARGILSRQELDQVTIDFRIAEARLKDAALKEFKTREELKVYFKNFSTTVSTEAEPNLQERAANELPTVLSTQWPWLKKLSSLTPKKSSFTVESHPVWQQLNARLQASAFSSKNKFSTLLPSLDLGLSYNNRLGPQTGNQWVPQYMGVVTLTIPLFNRLDNLSGYQLARESEIRSRLQLERSTRELTAQWVSAETEFQTQVESALTREQTLKISHTLYQDNFRRFQAGRSTANDLFNDQDRLYQAELLVVQGWRAAHESYLRLCHSTGQPLLSCTF